MAVPDVNNEEKLDVASLPASPLYGGDDVLPDVLPEEEVVWTPAQICCRQCSQLPVCRMHGLLVCCLHAFVFLIFFEGDINIPNERKLIPFPELFHAN